MNTTLKMAIAFAMGFAGLGLMQANASHKPDYCAVDHDHRSHDRTYYDHYPADSYYNAGQYRSSRYDDRYGRGDRYDRGDRDDYRDRGRYSSRRARSQVVHRQHYNTRYRAEITVFEEVYWTRSGRRQLVCTVLVRGPEARYVSRQRVSRIAHRDCSRRARIQYR